MEAKEETLRVLLVRPQEEACIVEMPNTLEAMQKMVGGYIEEIMPFPDEVALICNEEGKCSGLSLNRAIYYQDSEEIMDIIAGDFFVVFAPYDAEDFQTLPDNLMSKYYNLFRYPEMFFRDGDEFKALKME